MKKSDLQEIGLLIDERLDKKLDEKLEPIKKTLDEHSDKLDALVLDVIHIQKKTDILPDLHGLIKDTREKLWNLKIELRDLKLLLKHFPKYQFPRPSGNRLSC